MDFVLINSAWSLSIQEWWFMIPNIFDTGLLLSEVHILCWLRCLTYAIVWNFIVFYRVQSTCWWLYTRRNLGKWVVIWQMVVRYLLNSNKGDDWHIYLSFPSKSSLCIMSHFPLFSAKFKQSGAFYSGCWIIWRQYIPEKSTIATGLLILDNYIIILASGVSFGRRSRTVNIVYNVFIYVMSDLEIVVGNNLGNNAEYSVC